jgi:uncharacterized protein
MKIGMITWINEEDFKNAKEKGLDGLAAIILAQDITEPVTKAAESYLCEEKEVRTVEEAIAGAMDIIAEDISDQAEHRSYIREVTILEEP